MDVIDFGKAKKQGKRKPAKPSEEPYYTIDEFCKEYGVSWPTYCLMEKHRIGPPTDKYTGGQYITFEDAEAWSRKIDEAHPDMQYLWTHFVLEESEFLEARWREYFREFPGRLEKGGY